MSIHVRAERAREQLQRWFETTLQALDPQALMRQSLAREPDLRRYRRVTVLAMGKAAEPMLAGWAAAASDRGLQARTRQAVLACPCPPTAVAPSTRVFVGGHPEPDAISLQAGEAMRAAADDMAQGPKPALLVALISGGGSALVELPIAGDLAALQRRNRRLVQSGAGIAEINLIRKHFSRLKGGRLAAAAFGPEVDQVSWILSDVPGDDPGAVSSGPTYPDATSAQQFAAACARWLPGEPLPPEQEPLPPGHPVFARSRWHILASNRDACAQVAARARAEGYDPVEVDARADESDWEAAAGYLAERWRGLRTKHTRPCLIAGGEIRVRVPAARGGRGGRNQQLALRVAIELEGEDFAFLSAGTDGVDGSSDAAGAIVDGMTAARARRLGLDPRAALADYNAEPLLDATGDLLRTGPTGNNLRDLRCFLTT